MREKFVLLAAALALAGCASLGNIGPPPSNVKALMKSYIEDNFPNPDSLRDVAISDAESGHLGLETGWIVCLQENDKNRMGHYAGLSRTAYLVRNDQITAAVKDAPVCADKTLNRWPEMEGKGGSSK